VISERLKRVILRELDLDDCEIVDETEASDVPGWDSLNHVRIIDAIEREFGLQFRSLEIIRIRNVGDLQQLIDGKTSSKPRDARSKQGLLGGA
jgi:acyl carrier protein